MFRVFRVFPTTVLASFRQTARCYHFEIERSSLATHEEEVIKMPDRPVRCQHGTLLYNSWRDCPYCWEEQKEEDAYEESRRQTSILEEIRDNQYTKSNLLESQELARSAEDRFRIRDLSGAIELINQAIKLEPSFMTFYYQRSRYFFLQEKREQTVSDLHNFFKANPENFGMLERQLKAGKLNELSSRKSEFEALIRSMLEKARTKAIESYESFARCCKNMEWQRRKFNSEALNTLDRHNQHIQKKLKNASYLDFVEIAENSKIMEDIANLVEAAIKCKDELAGITAQVTDQQRKVNELDEKEDERRGRFRRIEKIKALNRKFWASIGYIVFVLLAFVTTAVVLGLLTYFSFTGMIKKLGLGRPANDFSLAAWLEILLGIVWGLANLALIIATVVAPFKLAGYLLNNMGDFVGKVGKSKGPFEETYDLQQQRSKLYEKESQRNNLQNRLKDLSSNSSTLLNKIVWNNA